MIVIVTRVMFYHSAVESWIPDWSDGVDEFPALVLASYGFYSNVSLSVCDVHRENVFTGCLTGMQGVWRVRAL